jgi:cytochrome b6-f complex iron-sulfur subunit
MKIELIFILYTWLTRRKNMNMNRRKLLSWFGLGWLATLLPSSLGGCSDVKTSEVKTPEVKTPEVKPSVPSTSASNTFKAIGTIAQLEKDDSLLSEDKKIAVVRDPQDKNKVIAVNSICTHKGCAVKWKASDKSFVCPCHDAEFAADGTVREGPAKKPLQRYEAKIENGKVLVNSTIS